MRVTLMPMSKCSTPFGITDAFAKGRINADDHTHVLNAFPHHSCFRLRLSISSSASLRCSTPFGITDAFARAGKTWACVYPLCSTPFGITDAFAREPVYDRRQLLLAVLNAFRHH